MRNKLNDVSPEEHVLFEYLKRYELASPAPRLKNRIFSNGTKLLFDNLTWAAALIVFCFGIIVSNYPGRSEIPTRIILQDVRIEVDSPRAISERLKAHYLNLLGEEDG